MDPSSSLGGLQSRQWEQLQEIADRFEKAWEGAASVELGEFLPASGDSLRPVALLELVKTDLEIRWRRGLPTCLEDYLRKLPELGPAAKLSPKLIYEEYRVRYLYGDRPALAAYQGRFPEQFEEFQRLVQQQPPPTMQSLVPAPPVPPSLKPAPPMPPEVVTTLNMESGTLIQVGGGYRLLQRIGSGSFGEVWRAEAPGGFPAAIKIIFRPVDHDEAQREVQALELIKKLRHPYLLQTQGYWASADRLVILMELADGSLRDRHKECKKAGQNGIPVLELAGYMREAAEALDYLHGEHVQHRDIKPDNVLLLQRHVKVADFGLARLHETRRLATATGSGTPAYMAPEIWRGKISPHSDQYSLALTYAELRLDRRLFASRELIELMQDHLERTPDLKPLHEAEQQVLLKALAKDPGQRYPSCRAFVQALEQALTKQTIRSIGDLPATRRFSSSDGRGLSATEPVELPAPAPPRKRGKSLLAALLLLLIGVGAFAGYQLYQRGRQPPVAPSPVLPPGCEPEPGSQIVSADGKRFYQKIAYVLPDKTRVPFLLIAKRPGTDDPETFYIMQDKVWVGLFKKCTEFKPQPVSREEFDKANPAFVRGQYLQDANDRHPVLGVFVDDAYQLARWLGGNLPTARQWDKAAGRLEKEPGEGPFRPLDPTIANEVAVNRTKEEGPMEVGQAAKDVSRFGCRDMAGNGEEWTRTVNRPSDAPQVFPIPKPTSSDRMFLRGRSFLRARPLRFQNLEGGGLVQPYTDPDAETGFRVVIEP